MKKDKYPNQSLIKRDIEEIVAELLVGALQVIADLFTQQNETMATKADITRIENKLDPTIDAVDDHSTRIKRLEARTT